MPKIITVKKFNFLISNAKETLNHLKQAFVKASIF